jgi:hypothetical protein
VSVTHGTQIVSDFVAELQRRGYVVTASRLSKNVYDVDGRILLYIKGRAEAPYRWGVTANVIERLTHQKLPWGIVLLHDAKDTGYYLGSADAIFCTEHVWPLGADGDYKPAPGNYLTGATQFTSVAAFLAIPPLLAVRVESMVLQATGEALHEVREQRFFQSERGYHGRFYCALQVALNRSGLLKDGVILEMEYQKSSRHGISQRPDIVLHVPAEVSGGSVVENNLAVFALKRRASVEEAREDFAKLDEMCECLRYGLAVFINVDCERHHKEVYSGPFAQRIRAFAVSLVNEQVRIVGPA